MHIGLTVFPCVSNLSGSYTFCLLSCRLLTLSASSPAGFPEHQGEGCDGDITSRAECPKAPHALHTVQLCIPVFILSTAGGSSPDDG